MLAYLQVHINKSPKPPSTPVSYDLTVCNDKVHACKIARKVVRYGCAKAACCGGMCCHSNQVTRCVIPL